MKTIKIFFNDLGESILEIKDYYMYLFDPQFLVITRKGSKSFYPYNNIIEILFEDEIDPMIVNEGDVNEMS